MPVSIPRWYDYKLCFAEARNGLLVFQFQDGTIISEVINGEQIIREVSIPRWYDYKIKRR